MIRRARAKVRRVVEKKHDTIYIRTQASSYLAGQPPGRVSGRLRARGTGCTNIGAGEAYRGRGESGRIARCCRFTWRGCFTGRFACRRGARRSGCRAARERTGH